MSADPSFTSVPHLQISLLSAANTNLDGTGTMVDLFTGATNGSRIGRIVIKATGTTTAGMVRLFIYDGVNTRLWREIVVSAITPAAATQSFETALMLFGEQALNLPATYVLRGSTHNAETFAVTVEGGDY